MGRKRKTKRSIKVEFENMRDEDGRDQVRTSAWFSIGWWKSSYMHETKKDVRKAWKTCVPIHSKERTTGPFGPTKEMSASDVPHAPELDVP